jgi:hypothetical protein
MVLVWLFNGLNPDDGSNRPYQPPTRSFQDGDALLAAGLMVGFLVMLLWPDWLPC